jgi:two-component system, sensor histidine kinase RpfC
MIGLFNRNNSSRSPEQEILLNRVGMGSVAAIVCYFVGFDTLIVAAFVIYLTCNAGLMLMEHHSIMQAEKRWFVAIGLDVAMATATMLVDAEGMAWAYVIILRMILGNGFRFGLKWLAFASFLSATGFGVVVLTTAYWHLHQVLGYSLVLGLIAIPNYCSTLIRKISKAKEQAETANRAKSYFLASVSHELRTPLNAILGYGNHLREMGLPPRQHSMIDASVLAAEHLLHLIEQLLEVAKTESGSVQVNNIDFRTTDILSEVRNIMAVRADDKGLELNLRAEPHCDQLVNGPADMVRNILLNLVGNAIKFTENGSVSIICGMVKSPNGDKLSLHVIDTGIGIAQNAIGHIFQPFQQADDSVMDRFGGTGLGLAICKQICEQIGGTIEVKSVVGYGSEFHVIVPITETAENIETDEAEDTDTIRIISMGQLQPELLANARSGANFVLRHVNCSSPDEVNKALDNNAINSYQIALIGENLAQSIEPDHPIWARFAQARIATVLVKNGDAVELEDITLRAAFASVIPASPDFQTLRSAIRIGCSFARQPLSNEDNAPQSPVEVTPRSVLVADDNRTNRNVLAAILEAAGHEVTMVADGDEALSALEEGGFDILLLDVNMPRLNGIDAASMWRQIEGGRSHLPIIGVTADATSETMERCLAAGMDARVTKPFDSKKLLSLIDDYTNKGDNASATSLNDPMDVVVSLASVKMGSNTILDPAQMDYLRSIGDESFVSEMISSFIADITETIEPMRASVADQDVQQFRFCAHAFKSSAHNIGAAKLAELCGRLENITEGEFNENAPIYLAKVERAVDDVTNALQPSYAKITNAVNQ